MIPVKIIVFLIIVGITAGCTSSANPTAKHSELSSHSSFHAKTNAIGEISAVELLDKYTAFSSTYQKYELSEQDSQRLKAIKDPMELIIVFGTWCHDSQREVPRLLKLIDTANNPNIKTRLIGVGYDKKIPIENNPYGISIRYTPTAILLDKDHREIGRIIETPNKSWAADIEAVLN
ncbi:thioredoxin family protein [Pleionea sediminis]|uniref:thioredoxin family protein n=1 Tax=Pleionea sediminis TaxID=2569479 RepID=UPI0011870070|nr:thioredoxin family protein [Pleionea sediminis]